MTSVRRLVLLAFAAAVVSVAADADKERAVRMKTSRQLKDILDELSIPYAPSMSKDDLRALALKEDAVSRWEELHPEKKRKPRASGGGGGFGGDTPPEGMDPAEWERLMAQIRATQCTDPSAFSAQ